MMHADRKRTIRAYINDQIETRGLMLNEFSMLSGIPAPYISLLRNDITSTKLPEKVFTYLEAIYMNNAFQQLFNGDWVKYKADKTRTQTKKEPVKSVPAPNNTNDLEKVFDVIKSFCDSKNLTFELNFKLKS